MQWTQVVYPFDSLALSAMVAAIPVVFIFTALMLKMKGYLASILTLCIALVLALTLYGMPAPLAAFSALQGALYGLFPICWIILGPVFLFNLTVKSGQFAIIRDFMATITPDRRLQALLIAFSFGAFLEGSAGFGAPVAISAAMLIGLGFNPLYAAGLCLIANTAPVAFGSIGIPIIMASRISDLPELAISQMVGRTLPLLSLLLPLYLVVIMAGFRRAWEVWPAILVSGLSFSFFQWFTANYLGPMLPDVLAGIASILCVLLLVRFWRPRSTWEFSGEDRFNSGSPTVVSGNSLKYTGGEILRAWSPYLIMTLFIVTWGLAPVKATLNDLALFKIHLPFIHDSIYSPSGALLEVKPYEINLLSAPGSAVLFAAIISVPVSGLTWRDAVQIYGKTLKQLRWAILTIASVVAFAFVANYSGMSLTLGLALAATGVLFPFFSPILGWIGVFITGSDTSSNALFCKLQAATADTIGVDPVVTVAANASGGVTGKMISPQSVATAAAAVGLAGKESDLFRFTVRHSLLMLFIISILVMLQAYVFTGIIPEYEVVKSVSAVQPGSSGWPYLIGLGVALFLLIIVLTAGRKTATSNRS
ncbi:lactate permease LctP family transporter [Chryseolinea sp. T2]|uniref:L-lactate permease n=1 Tax=Chryseolinea sp. T2 TaxID=3129255 RepID=UPI0030788E7E